MISELIYLFITIWFLLKYFHFSVKPSGTPPGKLGLPVIGVTLPKDKTLEEYISSCREKYGDTFWLTRGSRNTVYICKYDVIDAALNNPALQGRVNLPTNSMLIKGSKSKGIVFSQGTPWKNLRRFAIRRLRDGGMGKSSMESIIQKEADSLAEDFEKHVGYNKEFPWSINGSVLNVIWRLVADQRYNVDDAELRKLYNTVHEVMNQIQGPGALVIDTMPWVAKWSPTFILSLLGIPILEQKFARLLQFIQIPVDFHKKTLDEDHPRDLIDSYLIELNKLAKATEQTPDMYSTFCEDELMYTVTDLFMAGSETTSSTIRWFLILMTKYPSVQQKVHEELDNVLSEDRTVTLDDKQRLPFLEAAINETLRLKPILPFGLLHIATENTTVDGFFIPKGTHICPNVIAYNKSPDIWKKPNDFYPEHFLKEDGTFNAKKHILTFAIGRRVCLGENLARMILFFALSTLMKKFSFAAPEGEAVSIEQRQDQPIFTLPKSFNVIINKR